MPETKNIKDNNLEHTYGGRKKPEKPRKPEISIPCPKCGALMFKKDRICTECGYDRSKEL